MFDDYLLTEIGYHRNNDVTSRVEGLRKIQWNVSLPSPAGQVPAGAAGPPEVRSVPAVRQRLSKGETPIPVVVRRERMPVRR
jgi:hypothetical protein